MIIIVTTAEPASAQSSPAPVDLGKAASFAAFAEDSVSNGRLPSAILGDVGVHQPGPSAIEGFPPGVIDGNVHVGDVVAKRADADIEAAYEDVAERTPDDSVGPQLGGMILAPGIYRSTDSLDLEGTLTLDAQGDRNAVFVFQTSEDSSLIAQQNSAVVLTNGASACNVYWQVGRDFALFEGARFAGNVLASRSVGLDAGAAVEGRLLVRDGPVVLVAGSNVVNRPDCDAPASTRTTTRTSSHDADSHSGSRQSADRDSSGAGSDAGRPARSESTGGESAGSGSSADSTGGGSPVEESANRRSAGDGPAADEGGARSTSGESTARRPADGPLGGVTVGPVGGVPVPAPLSGLPLNGLPAGGLPAVAPPADLIPGVGLPGVSDLGGLLGLGGLI